MLVWLNGRWLPARRARVSALDRGLLHGDGVYDTWRTYGGVPFAVPAHLRRLAAATRVLGLAPPGPADAWERRTRTLVARNGARDVAVRLTITRGTAGLTPTPSGDAPPTMLLLARPLPPDAERRHATGIRATLLPFPRATAPWGGLKLVGNVSAVAGRRLVERRRAGEGLYVTADGEVTEGTSSNLFIVERGAVVTPPLDGSILGGVTRDLVLRLARRLGVAVREEAVSVSRLRRAAEVFVTASTIEVMPVVRLDAHVVGAGRPGAIARGLQDAYRAHVVRELARRR